MIKTKSPCLLGKIAKPLLFCMILLIGTGYVWARDWHELHDLDHGQLTAKVEALEKAVDQDPEDYETLKGLGIAYHIKAAEDAKGYAAKAVEMLSRAREMSPDDNETLCYLGSATTIMARTTWNPIKKMSYVKKGMELMDMAVERDPDNYSVRATRGLNAMHLPAFLEREPIALEDFEHLARLFEKDADADISLKRRVYKNLSEIYARRGEKEKAEKYRKLYREIVNATVKYSK
jgi:tetratricopeptide (TPR) repeat protein